MIYAYIGSRAIPSDIAEDITYDFEFNLDILDHRHVDTQTGIDTQRSMAAEDEIRQKFELPEDKTSFERYQLLWWLGKNDFLPTGNNEYYLADDNLQ